MPTPGNGSPLMADNPRMVKIVAVMSPPGPMR